MSIPLKTRTAARTMVLLGIIAALGLAAAYLAGCRMEQEIVRHSFESTYSLGGDEGRSISISGNSAVMPGETADYDFRISNGGERWQDEYCVLLIDSKSVVKEISRELFDIPAGGAIQKTLAVTFPADRKCAMGLCVIIPQRARMITTLAVGVENASLTELPDIDCPSAGTHAP